MSVLDRWMVLEEHAPVRASAVWLGSGWVVGSLVTMSGPFTIVEAFWVGIPALAALWGFWPVIASYGRGKRRG